ncbi:hypothetical protein GQ53DRAFT_783109 [Thozetella sp. PMI_491]|nr:hypothetical protein GQ53DRAFT_783109 [Thozetella sp. PMI_491]
MGGISDFKNYPFLTPEEFTEVCHHLDSRYCRATLGPVRRQWRLRCCSTLNLASAFGPEYNTYVQIIRPLDGELDDGDLSSFLDNLSFDTRDETAPASTKEDADVMELEEADKAVIPKKPAPDFGYVTYEIHWHPTYQVPCLWFALRGLPADEPAFNIDTVFRRLVPDQHKVGLRNAGPVGGISADHHPVTGVPTFFIHPCLLGEAMSHFPCSKESYLMVWLGLVGGCVGLWAPKEMALE